MYARCRTVDLCVPLAVFLCASAFGEAVPPFKAPLCFSTIARVEFSYPEYSVSRLAVFHADLRVGDFRQDVFNTHMGGSDLERFHTSIFRDSTFEHVLAMPFVDSHGSTAPATCMILPYSSGVAKVLQGAQFEYLGLSEVEASVAAVDTALEADSETLLLHEWVLRFEPSSTMTSNPRDSGVDNLTVFAHLDGDGKWQPMIVDDVKHRTLYTIIEHRENCDFFDSMHSIPSLARPLSFRDLLFDVKYTTNLLCEPLG